MSKTVSGCNIPKFGLYFQMDVMYLIFLIEMQKL